jgi:4-hydroxy-2-oxoheptanedioate aldolase
LAADMGFIGQAGQAEVKAAGILTLDENLHQQCRALGATFIATEIDVTLFARNMRGSAQAASERLRD